MSMSFGVADLPSLAQHQAHRPHAIIGDLLIAGDEATLYESWDARQWAAIADPIALQQIKSHLPESGEYLGGASLFAWVKANAEGLILYDLYSIRLCDVLNRPPSAWTCEIPLRPIPSEYDYRR